MDFGLGELDMKAHDLVGQSRCRHEIPNETIQVSKIEGLTYEGGSTVFDCLRPEAIILASGYDDDANRAAHAAASRAPLRRS